MRAKGIALLCAAWLADPSLANAHEPEYGARATIAKRRPQTASSTVVTSDDVSAVPTRTAEDALRLVPGLVLVQHGSEGKGYQFFMRGFDAVHGADLELTVEGIPLNEWSNIHAQGYLDLGIIAPEAVRSVEVTKGPFTLEQGAFAMAGSANYELGIAPASSGVRAGYSVGSTQRHRLLFSYAPKDDTEQFIAAESLTDRGFGENRETQRASASGKLHLLDSAERGKLSLLGAAGIAAFGLPGTLRDSDVSAGSIGFYDAYTQATDGTSLRGLAAFRYQWQSEQTQLKLLAYGSYRKLGLFENFTGYLVDPVHGDFRDQRQNTWSFGVRSELVQTLLPTLGLRLGIGLRGELFEQSERNVDEDQNFVAARRKLAGLQLLPYGTAGVIWNPNKLVHVEAGSRLDLVYVNVDDALSASEPGRGALAAASPRALLSLRVHPTVKLSAAYGRGFRPPEARAFSDFKAGREGISDELAGDSGAPRATQSDSFEVGARVHSSRYYSFDAAAFATRISRESIYDHVSATNLELNGTRRLGGELVVQSLPLDWLRLSADLTLVDARFIESKNRVPLAPWLTCGVRSVLIHPSGFQAGLRFLSVAARPLPHGARGEPLYMLDATFGYAWRWLRLDAALENLLLRENKEGQYHFASHWDRDAPASALPSLQSIAGPPFNARLSASIVF